LKTACAGFSAEAKPPAHQASDGLYWLLSDEQEDVASHSHYRHYARKVLTAAGLSEVSQISIDLDPDHEKLAFHRITLWRKGKPREMLARLSPTWLRREEDWDEGGMLDGRKTLLFTLDDVRIGDVVEFAYTLRGDNPIFGGMASGTNDLQYGVPVERLRLRILHPPAREVHLTLRNGALEPKRSREGDVEALTWDLARTPGRLDDDDAPAWYEPYPHVEWSEFKSWGEVVAWAEDLYAADEPLSPELKAFASSLRPLDPRERIRRTLRMVQDEVRYLGLEMGASSHKPAHPNAVYARRFGDCKDKALLFCALMRELGIEAAPALVNTRAAHETPAFQPSPEAFDHVIARVKLDGKYYWCDATLDHQRGDPLENQNLPYGKGLAIVHGNRGFDDIEMRDGGSTRVKVHEVLRARAWDSAATYTVTTEYTGSEAEEERSRFAEDSRERLVQENLNYRARPFPHIRPLDSLRITDDTSANRVTVVETYAVDSLCSRGATGRLECSIYPEDAAAWVGMPERKIRSSPYALAYPKNVEEEILLDLPEEVAFNDDARTVDNPDFRFSWDESRSGKKIKLAYTYEAKSDHVPLERFPAYLRALDEIRSNLGATLYPGGAGWPAAGRLNHLLIFFCAGWIGVGLWAARGLGRLGPRESFAPEARPLGGGMILLALSLVLSPFIRLFSFRDALGLFDVSTWNALAVSGSHPWRIPLLLVFLSGEIVILCATIGLWPLFFGRRAAFPKALLWAGAASMGWRLAYFAAERLLPGESLQVGGDTHAFGLLGTLGVTLAWVVYALRSPRARETFTLPGKAAEPLPAGAEKAAAPAEHGGS
jgi:hypothetical protein